MRTNFHVCAEPGCARVVSKNDPCPEHSRPKNAKWSSDRSGADQHRFRRQVLERDCYRCVRCGHHDPSGSALDAHHTSSDDGVTLCNSKANGCHRAVDAHAR